MLHKDLDIPHAGPVLRKGYRREVDSYSALRRGRPEDRRPASAVYLRQRGLKRVFLAGLATDFCVAWSALDARRQGFEALVIEDACRGIGHAGLCLRQGVDGQ